MKRMTCKMIKTKMLNISLTYKTKSNVGEQIKTTINNMLKTDEFDTYMSIITKETTINIEHAQDNETELLITMFTTVDEQVKPVRRMRAFIEEQLTKLVVDNVTCRLIRRRVY